MILSLFVSGRSMLVMVSAHVDLCVGLVSASIYMCHCVVYGSICAQCVDSYRVYLCVNKGRCAATLLTIVQLYRYCIASVYLQYKND